MKKVWVRNCFLEHVTIVLFFFEELVCQTVSSSTAFGMRTIRNSLQKAWKTARFESMRPRRANSAKARFLVGSRYAATREIHTPEYKVVFDLGGHCQKRLCDHEWCNILWQKVFDFRQTMNMEKVFWKLTTSKERKDILWSRFLGKIG